MPLAPSTPNIFDIIVIRIAVMVAIMIIGIYFFISEFTTLNLLFQILWGRGSVKCGIEVSMVDIILEVGIMSMG